MKDDKRIEDYLHLIIGCECEVGFTGHTSMRRLKLDAEILYDYFIHLRDFVDETGENLAKHPMVIKPILRRLDSQTREEQMEELNLLKSLGEERTGAESCALLTFHRLKKGFDLFGLIDSNLAIDSSTIKSTANE